MPVFARPFKPEPIPLFEITWQSSADSLQRAYDASFGAAEARNELLNDVLNLSVETRLGAYAEDIVAHQQAGVVLLATDDALQRLGKAMLGRAIGLGSGFGPVFNNGVSFTTLLHATTNAMRHVSQWDDDADREDDDQQKLYFPYDDRRNHGRAPLTSIEPIQKVLGYGIHERVHVAPCFDVLAVCDGKWRSGKTLAEFSRFDSLVRATANELIAECQGR